MCRSRHPLIIILCISFLAAACGGGVESDTGAGDSPSASTPVDTLAPSVTIDSPTSSSSSSPSYSTSSATINLSGTASDNIDVTQVTWSNSRGGSGMANGTAAWNASGIALQSGPNTLTITAHDTAGNTATDALVVTYSTTTPGDTTTPVVTISSPTSTSSYTATSGTMTLAGSASDNVSVTQVTWSNSRGGSGTASGTASWNVGGVTLQSGSNIITVTARDAAGNTATDTLAVIRDTTPPTVSSTTPTSGATNVSSSAAIAVIFSEPMSTVSIHSGTFTVSGVSGNVSVSGATATFTPSTALANTTNYTVSIIGGSGGVKDVSGNALVSSYTWTFTTATPDNCASSTVLCVDDTPGATREYSTIQAAADAALPGDTILVHDGNYTGFQVSRGGTQALPIVFRAAGANAVINRDGPTGDGIRLQNVNYTTLDGFNIQGTSQRCIAARGATATSPMRGNVVRNNRCTNTGVECIYVSQFSGSLVENNVLSGCGASGASKSHGIYLANAGSDNTTIRGNTISNATPAESAGIHINGDASIGGDGIVSGLTIENNAIHDMAVNGLSLDGVQNSVIRNNLIYGNGRHALRAFQIDAAAGPANLSIVNNTFNGTGGWAIKISEDAGGHTIFNNILLGSSGSICVSNTNLISNDNAAVDRFSFDNESTVVTLASWRTQKGNDANSFVTTSSSLFVNAAAGDYRLNNVSPAIDTGRSSLNSVNAPTTDLSGGTRPRGLGYDIGAYEN